MDVQLDICRKIAHEKKWYIVKEWALGFSGRTDTQVFEEQLAYIDAHPGGAQFYLFRAIDRFTRKGCLGYELMRSELEKRGIQMVDSYNIIQPPTNTLKDLGFEYDWSKLRPSEISEVVLATVYKQQVTGILTQLIGQEIRLTQRGYKVREAVDGYVNSRIVGDDGKKRTIQVRDPERAPFYEEMFALRASGLYSDKEIVKHVNAKGFRTRFFNKWNREHTEVIGQGGGHRLTVKRLQEKISRPIYAGVVVEKWTNNLPVRAQYEGLISIEQFNQANRGKVYIKELPGGGLQMLYDYHPDRKIERRTRYNSAFPYKNAVLCPICHKPFLGSFSRSKSGKRVPYYHCSRGHKRIGVPRDTFDAAVEKYVRSLRFKPEIILSLNAVLLDRYREEHSKALEEASAIGHGVAELEDKKAQAVRSFIAATNDMLKREIEKEIEAIETDIINSKSVRNTLEVQERDIHRFVRRAKYIMEHPATRPSCS